MENNPEEEKQLLENERYQALQQVKDLLEPFVTFLGFIWLVLLIVEFVWGTTQITQTLFWLIWGIFMSDFLIRLIIAPKKLQYLQTNWLTTLSLFVPALRVFRFASLVRLLSASHALRATQLLRVISSFNRGMRALQAHLRRRQAGYILALTVIVLFIGAAAIFLFEQGATSGGFPDYWHALYWTGMILTTLGSDYWPQTGGGQVLTFLLALYAFTMFGYLTATLATFFIGRETESDESELAAVRSIEGLRAEIAALRAELRQSREER